MLQERQGNAYIGCGPNGCVLVIHAGFRVPGGSVVNMLPLNSRFGGHELPAHASMSTPKCKERTRGLDEIGWLWSDALDTMTARRYISRSCHSSTSRKGSVMRKHSIFWALRLVVLMVLALDAISCTQAQPTSSAAPAPATSPVAVPTAANAAGTWKWSVDAGGNPITHTAVLKQDGEKLTGTFTDSFDNATVNIKEGKIHDGQVTLTVVRPFQDSTMTFNFVGKLDGNTITGKMAFTVGDQPNTADWKAQRGS